MQQNSSRARRLSIRPQWRDNRVSLVASVRPISNAPEAGNALMEQSPLTQQSRPDVFEPKVISLYRRLFREVEDDEKPEGFWTELFLLRPDVPQLRQILENTEADFLLHMQHQPQQLVLQSIAHVKAGQAPADENALDTLTVFFAVVLAKKFTNPSSDIIEVLAGLDDVDAVFTELVATLDHAIKDGRTDQFRQKAIKTAIAVVSGGYQTALVSYFINRDFFPATMKLVQQLDNPLQASEPLLFIGLLANYNKFEVHNQYRVRFADFVNDDAIRQVVDSVSWTCTLLRERYVAIQDDTPPNWSIGGTLTYVGLGALTGNKPAGPALTEDQQRELFTVQPGLEAASLLTLYDFSIANKLFCNRFITDPAPSKSQAPPFSNFLSFNSYLHQHAFRTPRASVYASLNLLILLILVEDPGTARLLCDTSSAVRLCRQKAPLLPLSTAPRSYASTVIDILIDGVNHNLRKRLDTGFYRRSLDVLSRLLTYLASTATKITYHWPELWRSLLSVVRFLTTYADDLNAISGTPELVNALVSLLSLAMTAGEAFLPDAAAFDDLLYKLVESGDALVKLRDVFALAKSNDKRARINSLIDVSRHYNDLIESHRAKKEHISAREVGKIIKTGYDTLSLDAAAEAVGVDGVVEAYREVEHKSELKRIARFVVGDAVDLVST